MRMDVLVEVTSLTLQRLWKGAGVRVDPPPCAIYGHTYIMVSSIGVPLRI